MQEGSALGHGRKADLPLRPGHVRFGTQSSLNSDIAQMSFMWGGLNRSTQHFIYYRKSTEKLNWATRSGDYSNAKMRFQSFFMLITVQQFFIASSYSAWM